MTFSSPEQIDRKNGTQTGEEQGKKLGHTQRQCRSGVKRWRTNPTIGSNQEQESGTYTLGKKGPELTTMTQSIHEKLNGGRKKNLKRGAEGGQGVNFRTLSYATFFKQQGEV